MGRADPLSPRRDGQTDPIRDPETPYRGEMDLESFREAAHGIVDRIADYLALGGETADGDPPVFTRMMPGRVRERLPRSAPEEAEPVSEAIRDFDDILYPALTHWNHPRYLAYFPSVPSAPGILGELLASAYGQNNMLWRTGPAATELEVRTLEWLRDLLGLPAPYFGHIVDTASTATLVALAAAREKAPDLALRMEGLAGRPGVPRLRIYCSEEAHASVDKACSTLGYGLENLRKVPTDEAFALRPEALEAMIAEDRAAGMRPLAVVATVGTTSSTAVDPVAAIAGICEREGLWLHVDAAYGGSAAICPEKRDLHAGWERADSIVVNPHKWLFVPLDCSALFVRDRHALGAAFTLSPEYITSSLDSDENLVNLMDYGFQMGRRWRSLKLWMVLRAYGAEGLRERLRYHMELARNLAGVIESQPGVEMMAPVPFATVCFRFRPEGWEDEERIAVLNAKVIERANATGEVFLSHTKLRGRYTLRLAIGHVRTHADDVRAVWDLLSRLAEQETSA